ncbi:MAG TPA: hypothetical protein VMN60_13600 [Longimicrobiales bacterium]|nr:hypothetical protein [Longimicrobiales bacterium]
MRIVLDPVPLVLGIYAYVGELLVRAVEKREDDAADALGRRLSRQRAEAGDREAQRMVRALHTDVKTADKLLKKTADVWKISQETDLVDMVIVPRGAEVTPKAYVLLRPREIRPLLQAVRDAAGGAGESEATLKQIDDAIDSIDGKPNDYLTFGFDPWQG